MTKKRLRIEEDSLGKVKVPFKALYGAQTQRAIDNFPVSGITFQLPFTNTFISMLGVIKDAAARANKNLGLLDPKRASAISKASKEIAKITFICICFNKFFNMFCSSFSYGIWKFCQLIFS